MDVLEFAINMELDGVKYYHDLAEANKGNNLYTVFNGLADDESNHAKILKEKEQGIRFIKRKPIVLKARSIFSKAGFEGEPYKQPEQVDLYRVAMRKEMQSIELYQKLLRETGEDKDLFEFLIAQEKVHYQIMEEIVRLVDRPNVWVESAEFGRREEY
ncbi:MAG: ferritin-like domain-containing protein [Christensenellales bacterium]